VRTTHAFQFGELPQSFKRSPLWPLLLVPAETFGLSEWRLGQVISALALGFCCVAVYGLARRWCRPPWAVAAALFVALFPDNVAAGWGGLLDPLLVSFVAIWLLAAKERVRWLCVAVAVSAGLLRPEGFLLGLLCLALGEEGKRWRMVLGGLLSFAPGILWLGLGMSLGRGSGYLDEVRALGNAAPAFLTTLFATPLRFSPGSVEWVGQILRGEIGLGQVCFGILCAGLWILIAVGMRRAFRKDALWTGLALTWVVGYLLIHTFFAASHFRYVAPALPALCVFLALGLHRATWLLTLRNQGVIVAESCALGVLLLSQYLSAPGRELLASIPSSASLTIGLAFLTGVGILWFAKQKSSLLLATWLVLLVVPSWFVLCLNGGRLWSEVPTVAAWLKDKVGADRRVMVYHPGRSWLLRSGLADNHVVSEAWLSPEKGLEGWKVAYAVWLPSTSIIQRAPDQWQQRADRLHYINGFSPLSQVPRSQTQEWRLVATVGPSNHSALIFERADRTLPAR
jgi:hypothetical protein